MSYKKRCVIHFWGCFSHSSENLRELQSSLEKRNKPLKIPKIKSKDMGWSIKKFKLIKIETLIKQIEEKVFFQRGQVKKSSSAKVTFRQLLTMLAIFDITFISTATFSFSVPQFSGYWKVDLLRGKKIFKIRKQISGLDSPAPFSLAPPSHTNVLDRFHLVSNELSIQYLVSNE